MSKATPKRGRMAKNWSPRFLPRFLAAASSLRTKFGAEAGRGRWRRGGGIPSMLGYIWEWAALGLLPDSHLQLTIFVLVHWAHETFTATAHCAFRQCQLWYLPLFETMIGLEIFKKRKEKSIRKVFFVSNENPCKADPARSFQGMIVTLIKDFKDADRAKLSHVRLPATAAQPG